jgi:hypothetical protein
MSEDSSTAKDLFGDPWTPPRDPRGRKRHRPLPQVREIVASLNAAGASDEEIALQIGLSVPTLKKYYFRELQHGVSLARNQMLRKLYEKGIAGNVSAMKAYLAETAKGAASEFERQQKQPRAAAVGKKQARQLAAAEVDDPDFNPGFAH